MGAGGPEHPDGYSLRARQSADEIEGERGRFVAALKQIKAHLAAGQCYQVNYTQNSDFAFAGDVYALYERLRRLQPTAYSALIHFGDGPLSDGEASNQKPRPPRAVLSLSPELFFEFGPTRDADKNSDYILETRPMKGTAPRHRDPELDQISREFLARDPKTLAEHRMIVDLLRNDLGVYARPGGVSVPEMLSLESHDTVHQMTSLVRARLPAEMNSRLFRDIFRAIFPCGSITGAPKLAARKIIAQLEAGPRGVYTGAIGYATPECARFNVAIRTLAINGARATYGSGCGIVWDSGADAEWQENRLKQAFLRPALDDFALIETIMFDGARFVLLDEHLERLEASARHYQIEWDDRRLLKVLHECAAANQGRALRARSTVDRNGNCKLSYVSWPHPFQDLSPDLRISGPGGRVAGETRYAIDAEAQPLRLAAERVYSGDPFRRHKTTERHIYDRELEAARAAGFSDSLFLNERGEVVESAIANLLIQTPGGEWLTPAVDCGALPGVFLAGLTGSGPGRVKYVRLTLKQALSAGRWYLVNSLRGAWPVQWKRQSGASNFTVR
ncbi:MAG: bifunctional anthranilate synthase component I family protein/class IV aminotransferase [Leptospirales bacterium]